MRTIVIMFAVLSAFVFGANADDTSPLPATNDSIIASIPTPSLREVWRQCSDEQRKMPANAELAQNMINLSANCELLHSRLIVGKSLSDYPGLLTLGYIFWDHRERTYNLKVICSRYKQNADYRGFLCTIDESYNIVKVSPVWWMH